MEFLIVLTLIYVKTTPPTRYTMLEFDIIGKYFKPLAQNYSGALNLSDDAAIISNIKPDQELVITKDALTEGTHFFKGDDPFYLAQKLMAVNLSDLAAMGATPFAYLLALCLPKNTNQEWIERFSYGLNAAILNYGGKLIGGDTTTHDGSLSLSLTAIGIVPKYKALLRSNAQIGDDIYVTGTIGDSYIGLNILKNPNHFSNLDNHDKTYFINRYHNPTPRLNISQQLIGIANSCTDISDGLLADLNNICQTSDVNACIYANKIPFFQNLNDIEISQLDLLSAGDDYELIFTAPKNKEKDILNLKTQLVKITRIGQITNKSPSSNTSSKKISLFDENNKVINFENFGYQHKL